MSISILEIAEPFIGNAGNPKAYVGGGGVIEAKNLQTDCITWSLLQREELVTWELH